MLPLALVSCLRPVSVEATGVKQIMPTDYRSIARQKAAKYGLLPDVFERQINQESGFRPGAVSSAGARGIAQIMPDTARGWGVNPDDPIAALDAAAKNMAAFVRTHGGMSTRDPYKVRSAYEKGLQAYNAGPASVGRYMPAETKNYIKAIIGPDKYSFTQALQGKQQNLPTQPQPQQVATTGGRTFIVFPDEDETLIPKTFLEQKSQPLKQQNMLDILTNAFAQVPNYLL